MGVELGKNVLKRWVKDYNLPIKLYQEPYFSYLVNLYDDYLGTKEKFDLLKNTVEQFKTEEEFLENYYEVKDKAIDFIKTNNHFKEFNEIDMKEYNICSQYPKNNIYKNTCNEKYFVSVDLVKANFQALKYVNPEIVLNANSYEEYISNFTSLEYLKKSKYLRQTVFGNLNPKRQIKIERYLIECVINYLCLEEFIEEDIQMATSDEVVFEVSKERADLLSKLTEKLTKDLEDDINIQVKIEVFKLVELNEGYVKEFINKEGYELKGVPQIYFPQVFKKYNNMELNEKDLVFFHEGQLATFLKPLCK